MYFPEELKLGETLGQFMNELRLATVDGLKGKDDCIDTISMLGYLKPWKPSDTLPAGNPNVLWDEPEEAVESPISSYIA